MSDDEEYDISTDVVRRKARRALDEAITVYSRAITDDEETLGTVGGWVITIFSPTSVEGHDGYLCEAAEGQPWHSSLGLAHYAVTHYEES